MQYLLWICFGLLAVVPWQIIRGQDEPENPSIKIGSGEWASDAEQSASEDTPDDNLKHSSSKKAQRPYRIDRPTLIFRSQSAQMENGPFTDASPSDGAFMPRDRLTGQPGQPFGSQPSPDSASRQGQAYGAQFRASAITGPAIGRKDSIFPLEMMPYMFMDNSVFFADIRGFATSDPSKGGFGGNFGAGFRQYLPYFDRILGVNAYYDYDGTSGALFREIGFGAESLGSLYDVRANAYMPTGSSSQQLSLNNINGTQVFSGHSLLVNQAKLVANALRGFDAEIGVPLPGRIAENHDIRVFGGGYYFGGDQISYFGGWKIRAQGNVTQNLSLNLQVSSDPQFRTNVVFGATWAFGGFKQSDGERKTQYSRMTTPVQRQYNIVVGMTTQILTGVTVTDPTTGNPYFFEHVSNNTSNPIGAIHDGTVEHPFLNLSDAQKIPTVPDEIIFVHGNSIYGTTALYPGVQVSLQPNVRVLGESTNVEHQVNTSAGSLYLPHPTAGPAAAPIFANSPGVGVLLANNSEFSGFQINNAASYGIIGNGVQNAVARQDVVSNSGNSSLYLNNTSGVMLFQGDTINDPTSSTVPTALVNGTTGTVIFTSDTQMNPITGQLTTTPGTINNIVGTGGQALVVQNTATGSLVNFNGSTTNDITGNGVLIQNDAGVVHLGAINVTNGLGIGLNILNDTGSIFGDGTIAISNSTGDSINIQGLTKTGVVVFDAPTSTTSTPPNPFGINITNRQARGIYLNSNAGNVTFSTPVNIQATATVPVAAIDYQNSSGNVTFNGLSPITIGSNVAGSGGGPGILIGGATDGLGNPLFNTGSFTVASRATIDSTSGVAIDVLNDKSTVTFSNAVNIGSRGNIGIQVLGDNGNVSFNGVTTITNENLSTSSAVDIRRNQNINTTVTFNTLNIQDPNGTTPNLGNYGIAVNIGGTAAADANTASVTINTLNIADLNAFAGNGTALYVFNEGTTTGSPLRGLTINNGTIQAGSVIAGSQAIDIENTTMKVTLTSVTSTGSPTNGITLINDQSFNQITNNILSPNLNDFMFQILGLPATAIRNGGTISFQQNDAIFISQTGRLFQTGDVNINQITSIFGQNGIVASGLLQLQVKDSDFGLAAHDAIVGTNIPLVDIETSYFNINGTTLADNEIHLTANTTLLTTNKTQGSYEWNIQNNNTASAGAIAGFNGAFGAGSLVVLDSGGQTLKTQTSPTQTIVTPLVFNFLNNNERLQSGPAPIVGTSTVTQVSGLAVNWTGFQSGSINQNTITSILSSFNQAISIVNTDATYLSNDFILGNTISSQNGAGNIGIYVNNNGPTDLTIGTLSQNGVNTPQTFSFLNLSAAGAGVNVNDTAMSISVLNSTPTSSLISITDNLITMNSPSGAAEQGIVFPILQGATPGPTTVNLSNNTVTITTPTVFPGQGIDFQSISGTINLRGTLSNTVTINGANTFPNNLNVTTADWVLLPTAANTRTGQFIVNGFTVR